MRRDNGAARNPHGKNVASYGHELLRRVVAAGRAGRFALLDVCPHDATRYLSALDRLIEAGCVERVSEGRFRWAYRLTASGAAIGGAAKPPKRWLRTRDGGER